MAVTDEEVKAIQLKLMDLEKTVAELGAALRAHPNSGKLADELAGAKDLITKLNLRLEQLEKVPTRTNGSANNGNHTADDWDI